MGKDMGAGNLAKAIKQWEEALPIFRAALWLSISCPRYALCSILSQNVHRPIVFFISTFEFITNNSMHLLTQPPRIPPLAPYIISHTSYSKDVWYLHHISSKHTPNS